MSTIFWYACWQHILYETNHGCFIKKLKVYFNLNRVSIGFSAQGKGTPKLEVYVDSFCSLTLSGLFKKVLRITPEFFSS